MQHTERGPDPGDYWFTRAKKQTNRRSAMLLHCKNVLDRPKDFALREIAGIAAFRGFSQADLAKRYCEATGRKISEGNVSKQFAYAGNVRMATLAQYAEIVGMTELHLQLVAEPWPFLLPQGGFRKHFLRLTLKTQDMPLLYESNADAQKLQQIDRIFDADHTQKIELVNRVMLTCERRFCGELFGKGREDKIPGLGVSRETLEQFNALCDELDGRLDLRIGLANRSIYEEKYTRALFGVFESLSAVTEQNDEVHDDEDGFAPAPVLKSADLLAILELTRRLMDARGINVAAMTDRLNRESSFLSWSGSNG